MKHTEAVTPQTLIFALLFPEQQNFSCSHSNAAAHCLIRAMCHLSGNLKNTYPSTHEGVILPFGG